MFSSRSDKQGLEYHKFSDEKNCLRFCDIECWSMEDRHQLFGNVA